MRISTANAYDATVATLTKRHAELSDLQTRISSQKRVMKASDDPTSAARAERELAATERITAQQRAVDSSLNTMTLSDNALSSADELLQKARELMVSAGNSTYGDSERRGIAQQIKSIRDQLLLVANSTDGTGNYLFGGQGSSTTPFVDTTGGVRYRATSGEGQVASGESLPGALDGAAAWMQAPRGNGVFVTEPGGSNSGSGWIDVGSVVTPSSLTGASYSLQFSVSGGVTTYSVLDVTNGTTVSAGNAYTSGTEIQVGGMSVTVTGAPANADTFTLTPSTGTLSVFDALDEAVSDLQVSQPNSGQLTQMTSSRLSDIDSVLSRLHSARSHVGETLNRIDNVTNRMETAKVAHKTAQSAAEDLDLTSAISDMSKQQTGYEVALQAYASIRKLSLFDYIR